MNKKIVSFVEGYQLSDRLAQDTISVKRAYIDICNGNLYDALIFSQIMYWHTNKTNGATKLRVERNGHYWLAKSYADWWDECRVNERTARQCVKRLSDLGLIHKKVWKFAGAPTVHLRVDFDKFYELIHALDTEDTDPKRHEMSNGNDTRCQNDTTPDARTLTETTSEITTELSTASGTPDIYTDSGDSQQSVEDSPTPSPKTDWNGLIEAINDVLGIRGSRERHIANMLIGRSKHKGYKEHNLPEPVTPNELQMFGKWYEKHYPDINKPTSPATLNDYIHRFRAARTEYERNREKQAARQAAIMPDFSDVMSADELQRIKQEMAS